MSVDSPLRHHRSPTPGWGAVASIALFISITSGVILATTQAFAVGFLFSRPLKMTTCELMLNTQLRDLAHPNTVLPVVRDLKYRIEKAAPGSINDGAAFQNLSYTGPIHKVPSKLATKMIQRLNGLEETLTKTNLDMQMANFEIRGNDISKALNLLEQQEPELETNYKILKYTSEGFGIRLLASYVNLVILESTVHSFGDVVYAVSTMDPQLFSSLIIPGILSYLNVKLLRDYFKWDSLRYDSNYRKFKDSLKKITQPGSTQFLFMDSSFGLMPVELHNSLMSGRDDQREEVRDLGFREFGYDYTTKVLQRLIPSQDHTDDDLQREVRNAGDIYRRVYIDQILYYDTTANEPVWMFFYRAYRNQPAGRKPTTKKVEAPKEVKSWLPGLAPVPNRY